MKPQFVMMRINDIQIPMIRIGEECYITQKSLEKLLGVDGGTLRRTFKNRQEEFHGNCVDSIHAIEFIKEHKELLGLNYVRGDMHLWSRHDMLVFAMLVRGPKGIELRSELIRFIEDNAKYDTVTKAEHNSALTKLANMEKQLDCLREEMEMVRPVIKELARLSGKSLQAHRETKRLRDIN